MEHTNRSGKPTPPPSPSFLPSPWKHSLPYNALSEEGSYGSFALYAPSPLPSSPMHSSPVLAGKDSFKGRHEQLYPENRGSMPRNLTRSISSSDSLRRHRRPLSELLAATDGPPSPLPANYHRRRPTLSTLMADSLDFDRGPRMDDPGIFPHNVPSHIRHQSASFATPPPAFSHAERSSHYLPPQYGFLSRARSDRYDLDRMMGQKSFDPQDYQLYREGLDPILAMASPIQNFNASNANADTVRINKFASGESAIKDDLANEHSYKRMQYLRARSLVKSQDLKAPLSPLRPMLRASTYNAGNVPQMPKLDDGRPSNGGVLKKVTMTDMLANDVDLGPNPSNPVYHHKVNGAGTVSFNNHRISLDGFEHRAYNPPNGGDENYYFGVNDKSVKRQNGAVIHTSVDPHGIKKSAESAKQAYTNGNVTGYGRHSTVFKHLSAQEAMPTEDALPSRKSTNQYVFNSVNEMQAFSSLGGCDAAIHKEEKMNCTGRSASSSNHQTDNKKRVASTLTKGHSVLDYVTENIVGKLILLSEKSNGHVLNEAATISAKLLFKRVLLVQIQAVAPKLADICADERELAAHSWAFQASSPSSSSSSSLHSNKRLEQRLSHEGLSLLHLQRVLYETGTSTFDTLMKIRGSLHELLIKPRDAEMGNGQQALRVACVGGAPGSAAVAMRLFLLMMRPEWQVQVDVWGEEEVEVGRRRIVEGMRLREIEWAGVDQDGAAASIGTGRGGTVEMVRRSAAKMMRQYKVVMMVNCGSSTSSEGRQLWRSMWERLYENAAPGAVVVVYERAPCRWDDIAPSIASWQFVSPAPGLDCVRVARKQLTIK